MKRFTMSDLIVRATYLQNQIHKENKEFKNETAGSEKKKEEKKNREICGRKLFYFFPLIVVVAV